LFSLDRMSPVSSDVFFYGLFMDRTLLASKGVIPPEPSFGIVRDWALRIGHRATLVPQQGSFVHGLVMSFPLPSLDQLYSEPSVAMYRPVAVLVELRDSTIIPALTYILPEAPAPHEANAEYAAKLRSLADRLGFPAEYVTSIA